MRKAVLGFVAVAAATLSTARAIACGYAWGCSSWNSFGYGQSTGYGNYGYLGVGPYEQLPVSTGRYSPGPQPRDPQFYYVNQGPTFSGPGDFAPYPTYQETAIRGWTGYERGVDYPYDGGPYGNATNHFSDAQPGWNGPLIQTYRWHRGHSIRSRVQYFGIRPGVRHGYAVGRTGYRVAGPGVVYAPRLSAARHQYPRPPRRAY